MAGGGWWVVGGGWWVVVVRVADSNGVDEQHIDVREAKRVGAGKRHDPKVRRVLEDLRVVLERTEPQERACRMDGGWDGVGRGGRKRGGRKGGGRRGGTGTAARGYTYTTPVGGSTTTRTHRLSVATGPSRLTDRPAEGYRGCSRRTRPGRRGRPRGPGSSAAAQDHTCCARPPRAAGSRDARPRRLSPSPAGSRGHRLCWEVVVSGVCYRCYRSCRLPNSPKHCTDIMDSIPPRGPTPFSSSVPSTDTATSKTGSFLS